MKSFGKMWWNKRKEGKTNKKKKTEEEEGMLFPFPCFLSAPFRTCASISILPFRPARPPMSATAVAVVWFGGVVVLL